MEKFTIKNVQDAKHWLIAQAVRLSKHTEEIVNITNMKNFGDVDIEFRINGKECPFLDMIDSFEQEVFKNVQKKLMFQSNFFLEMKEELDNTINKTNMKFNSELDKLFTEQVETISPFNDSRYMGKALLNLKQKVLNLLEKRKGRQYVVDSLNNSAIPSLRGKRWNLQTLNNFMKNLNLTKMQIRDFNYPDSKQKLKPSKVINKRYTPEKLAEVKNVILSLMNEKKDLDYVLFSLNHQKIYSSTGKTWTKTLLRNFILLKMGWSKEQLNSFLSNTQK